MDANTVKETLIRPKLMEAFGANITSVLMTRSNLASMDGQTDQEKLQKAVDFICSDPKVQGMWGASQVIKQKQEWMAAFS